MRFFAPRVNQKARTALAFHAFNGAGDARLQLDQVSAHTLRAAVATVAQGGWIHRDFQFFTARWPMSWRYWAPSKWMLRATS